MSVDETRTKWPGIYRRGNSYTFRVPDSATGRSYRGTARTLEEAKRARSKMVAKVDEEGSLERSKITFAVYAEQWLELYRGRTRRRIRPATLSDYAKVIRRHAVPFLGRRRMVEI